MKKAYRFEEELRVFPQLIRVGRNTSMEVVEVKIPHRKYMIDGEKYAIYHNGEGEPYEGQNCKFVGKMYSSTEYLLDVVYIENPTHNINYALWRKKWGRNVPETCYFKNGVIYISKGFEGQVIGTGGRIIKAISKVWGSRVKIKSI